MITYATEEVRQLHVDHRRCRFLDESNLEVSPFYTVNLCYGQCRAKLAIKLCGCAPFFYVGVQQGKVNTSRILQTTIFGNAEEGFVLEMLEIGSIVQSLDYDVINKTPI